MPTVKSTDPNSPDFLKIDSASEAAGAGVSAGVPTDYLGLPTSTPPDIGAFTPTDSGGGSVPSPLQPCRRMISLVSAR